MRPLTFLVSLPVAVCVVQAAQFHSLATLKSLAIGDGHVISAGEDGQLEARQDGNRKKPNFVFILVDDQDKVGESTTTIHTDRAHAVFQRWSSC